MNYYGIAHVTLVFFTRTLSNSFESFLFLALIYLINLNVSSLLTIILNSSNETTDDTNTHRPVSTPLIIDRHLVVTSLSIGFICALGIFNRPTFPAFAIVPLMYWFTKIMPIIGHSSRFHLFLSRIISFIVGTFILTSTLIILFDSYYYNNGFSFIIDLKNRLVICPLNFILYNIDSENLDKHGLHPPWLHFVVNATILFGPLHLGVILWSLSHVSSIKRSVIDRVLKIFDKKLITVGQSGIYIL
jgi:phosphatidylinositol glycan class Z